MRYSKSMIEAVKQVAMYEQFDYALLDRDNRIIAIFKGKDACVAPVLSAVEAAQHPVSYIMCSFVLDYLYKYCSFLKLFVLNF